MSIALSKEQAGKILAAAELANKAANNILDALEIPFSVLDDDDDNEFWKRPGVREMSDICSLLFKARKSANELVSQIQE